MTYDELVAEEKLTVTDEVCVYCKESKERETKFLVALPVRTRNLSLVTKVCPHCDGESLIEKAYEPRDEQEEQGIS